MTDLVKKLKKKYGADILNIGLMEVSEYIPTGSIALDKAIGGKGYPVKRITEIFGPESSGKSTLCYHAIIEAQKQGKTCVYIDAEFSFDKNYAELLGVNTGEDMLVVIQPDNSEDALSIMEEAVIEPEIGLVILDSVAAMVPKKESYGQGEIGDSHVGLTARIMSQSMRRITPLLRKTNAAIILVNQVRENISSASPYAGYNAPGGRQLRHHVHLIIQLSRRSIVKESDGGVSINVTASVKKSKINKPYQEAEFIVVSGKGIDLQNELVNLLIEEGDIIKAGSWYKNKDGETIGQGAKSVYQWIDENPTLVQQALARQGVNENYATKTSGRDKTVQEP